MTAFSAYTDTNSLSKIKKSCTKQLFLKLGSIDKALPSRGKLTRIVKANL